MFHIAICDDEPQQLALLENAVKRYIAERAVIAELHVFTHPDALLAAVQKKSFDLFILDVCMPMLSGIQVGKELLARGNEPQIVYVTTSPDYAVDAFALQAVHYLLKPFIHAQLVAAMDRAFAKLRAGKERFLTVQTKDALRRVPFSYISYCEARGNYQYIHLTDGSEIRLRRTSTELFASLNGDAAFVRCGASYIVNLEQVRAVDAKTMELLDGTHISIPRGAYSSLRERYFAFYFEEAHNE